MKYLAVIIFILVSSVGGYWYGFSVGFSQATTYQISKDALHGIDAIRALKYNAEVDAKDLHEVRINESLVTYGKYLEMPHWALPGLYSADSIIRQSFSLVTSYRRENPRIVEGIEYAPSNQVIKETEEYQLLDQELREQLENEESYFNRAMEAQ